MAETGTVYKIGISGSYGGMNLGDEAILQVIVQQLRGSLPVEITVFSHNLEDTLKRHKVDRAVAVRELTRAEVLPEVQRLDLFILGGGGILYDSEVPDYLREVSIAQELEVPVVVYAVSAGPLQDGSAQQLVRDCLNRAAVVTVRERRARQLLEQLGVTNEIHVTADPALLLGPEPLPPGALETERIASDARLVGIPVREPGAAAPDIDEEHYHRLLANSADYIIDRLDADLIFVPMERRVLDVQHSHAVIAQMAHADRATVLKGEYSPGQVLSLISHFELVVGMRLHFLMFAAVQRVPFVALPYAGKVTGFLDAFKMPAPPMSKVNAGQLIAHIDRSWDLRAGLRERIGETLPELLERARETNSFVVRLLTQDGRRGRTITEEPRMAS
ncbi:MAG: polysaccharide pyruvyl transferase family protein [Dehalococcoidia bacterium]